MVSGTASGFSDPGTVAFAVAPAFPTALASLTFWASLAVALVTAGAAAFHVNRWLLRRGKGHAVVHQYHDAHDQGSHAEQSA